MITGVAIFLHEGTVATVRLFAKPFRYQDSLGAWDQDGNAGVWQHDDVIWAYSQDTFDTPTVPNPPVDRFENQEIYAAMYNPDPGRIQQYHLDDNTFYNPPVGKPGSTCIYDSTPLQRDVDSSRIHDICSMMMPEREPAVFAANVTCEAGVTLIPMAQCWGADIDITTRGPGVNDWYGVPDTGKFGWMATQYTDERYGPYQWINFAKSRLLCIQA